MAKKAAAKKGAGKKTKKGAKKKAGAPKPKAAIKKNKVLRPMDALSDSERSAVFTAIAKTLRDNGVADNLAAVHFSLDEFDLMCPDGQVRRMVCRRQGAGVRCEPVCVPL